MPLLVHFRAKEATEVWESGDHREDRQKPPERSLVPPRRELPAQRPRPRQRGAQGRRWPRLPSSEQKITHCKSQKGNFIGNATEHPLDN